MCKTYGKNKKSSQKDDLFIKRWLKNDLYKVMWHIIKHMNVNVNYTAWHC